MPLTVADKASIIILDWLMQDYDPIVADAFYYKTIKVLTNGTGVASDGAWIRVIPELFPPREKEICYAVERRGPKGDYKLYKKVESHLFRFPTIYHILELFHMPGFDDNTSKYDLTHLIAGVSKDLIVSARIWRQFDLGGYYNYIIPEDGDLVLIVQQFASGSVGYIAIIGERVESKKEKRSDVNNIKGTDETEHRKANELQGSNNDKDMPPPLLELPRPVGMPVPSKPFNPYLGGKGSGTREEVSGVGESVTGSSAGSGVNSDAYNPYIADGARF